MRGGGAVTGFSLGLDDTLCRLRARWVAIAGLGGRNRWRSSLDGSRKLRSGFRSAYTRMVSEWAKFDCRLGRMRGLISRREREFDVDSIADPGIGLAAAFAHAGAHDLARGGGACAVDSACGAVLGPGGCRPRCVAGPDAGGARGALPGHVRVLGFFAPLYGGLAFIHYGLARLDALRTAPIEGVAQRVEE